MAPSIFVTAAKSEPGNREDLAGWKDREISKARKNWLGGIRKVIQAALNDKVTVTALPSSKGKQVGAVVEAKLTTPNDPSAVPVVPANAETIWPHRQVDLIRIVNRRLAGKAIINTHDIYCIKKVFDTLKMQPKFAYRSHRLAAPQYSDAFVEWIVEQFEQDDNFFKIVRKKCIPHRGAGTK